MPHYRPRLRGALLASTLLLTPLAAFAQTPTTTPAASNQDEDSTPPNRTGPTAEEAADAGGEVVITGSRLLRTDLTAPSPTTVVGEADIQLSGNVNLEKTLNEFPQLGQGNTSQVNNGGGAGVVTANLRGLGAQRTLTLVNGRRFIPADNAGNVDLASIPDALIQRSEIITGGASAVYGSDAIAGVVNFILKTDFQGLRASGQYGITDRGDAASRKIDLTFGTGLGDDRGNIAVSFGYTKQNPIVQADRPFGRLPLAEVNGQLVYSGSGNIPGTRVPLSASQRAQLVGVNLVPTGACTSITGIRFGAGGTPLPYCQPEDTYNYAPFNLLQRPLTRYNVSAIGNYKISDAIEAFIEGYFVNARNNSVLAPDSFTPVTPGAASSTLLVPNYATSASLSPTVRNFFINNRRLFDPDGDGTAAVVGGGRRADELGTRDTFYERQSYAITTGLRGNLDILNQDWRWEAFYQYLRNRTDIRSEGVISGTRLTLGLDSVLNPQGQAVCRVQILGCVPVSIFGTGSISQAAGAYLTPSRASNDVFVRQVAGGSLSGTLFELPAGPVALAAGVEYRKDKYRFTPSAQDLAFEYGAASTTALAGQFDVKEVFGEINVPLLSDIPLIQSLSVGGAARYSDYSTVGTVFTWKVNGEWNPIDWVKVRGGYNRAIRAPNINELFAAVSQGFTGGTDPCSRPGTGADTRSQALRDFCVQTGVPSGDIAGFTQATLGLTQESGGNPALTEETSSSWTIGGVISPPFIPRLNITVDYFNVEVKDAVATINAQQTLNDCYTGLNLQSPTCQSVFRLANGQIDFVRIRQNNIGAIKVRGLDAQIDYRIPLPDALRLGDGKAPSLTLQAVGSWLFERSQQVLATQTPQDCAGFYGAGCSSGTGGFILPDFKLNLAGTLVTGPLTFRAQGRMIGKLKVFPTVATTITEIDPVWYVDTTASIDVNETFTLFGGVNNLLDKQPPIFGTQFVGDANTDVSLYDTLGRAYFVGVRLNF